MSCNPAATSVATPFAPFVEPSGLPPVFPPDLSPEFNFLIESPESLCALNPDAECMALRAAAILALSKGWYVFGTPYRTKVPFHNSHGLRDASNDPKKALRRWNLNLPANPCVQLSNSNLTVLDIDKHPFKSIEDFYAWMRVVGLPQTYIVTSGRVGGGYHLYFLGIRTIPDCCQNPKQGRVGFLWQKDGLTVQGDVKCRGYVVLEGGLHKSGATYCGNGLSIAPLPDFIRAYRDPKDRAKVLLNLHQDKMVEEYGAERVGLDNNGHDARYNFWVKEAGHMRHMGYNRVTIYCGLLDVALRFFVDAEEYVKTHRKAAKRLARTAEKEWPCKRVIQATQSTLIFGPQYVQDEIGKRLDDIPFEEPLTRAEIEERIGAIEIAKGGKAGRVTVWRVMTKKGFTKAGRRGKQQLWVKMKEMKETNEVNEVRREQHDN